MDGGPANSTLLRTPASIRLKRGVVWEAPKLGPAAESPYGAMLLEDADFA